MTHPTVFRGPLPGDSKTAGNIQNFGIRLASRQRCASGAFSILFPSKGVIILPASFTVREVAALADVPVRSVDKAIEEKVLAGIRGLDARGRRMLPLYAVPYAAIVARLPITLSLTAKRNLARTLGQLPPGRMTTEPLEIAPAVTVDVPTLVGRDLAERAERYGQSRDDHIEVNPDIMGGTPVLRGTRITVYAVLGRLDGGDSVEDILADYPNLTREFVETAALYARTHPFVGRPGGRPWAKAA